MIGRGAARTPRRQVVLKGTSQARRSQTRSVNTPETRPLVKVSRLSLDPAVSTLPEPLQGSITLSTPPHEFRNLVRPQTANSLPSVLPMRLRPVYLEVQVCYITEVDVQQHPRGTQAQRACVAFDPAFLYSWQGREIVGGRKEFRGRQRPQRRT